VIVFAHSHLAFRYAEFHAAAEYFDIRYAFTPFPHEQQAGVSSEADDVDRAYKLVHLANDDEARQMAERVTCIKGVWQHWASGSSYDQVQETLHTNTDVRSLWEPWTGETLGWRASAYGHMRSLTDTQKRERIKTFEKVLTFRGPVRLRSPDVEWCFTEEWSAAITSEEADVDYAVDGERIAMIPHDTQKKGLRQWQRLLAVHVGRKVTEGQAREMITKMDVKQRAYIGNTTMEAGMSLVQAGMALAGPGKFIYDPFAGTGSLLLAAAAYGAHVIGSDIDGRMMRGKWSTGRERVGIVRSAKQYGIQDKLVDVLNFDVTQHPLRRGVLFDAIVTDPPYGIRAGAKRLGKRDTSKWRTEPYVMEDGSLSHQLAGYLPPSRPYALDDLLADLMTFAARMLVPRGRLVFWMPTMTEAGNEDEEGGDVAASSGAQLELRLPPTRNFRLVAHSLQDFGSWGRRLITLEKVSDDSIHELCLPSAPAKHIQASSLTTSADQEIDTTNGRQRVRATDNPDEFRNQVSLHGPAAVPGQCKLTLAPISVLQQHAEGPTQARQACRCTIRTSQARNVFYPSILLLPHPTSYDWYTLKDRSNTVQICPFALNLKT
jgi:tRNA (guanine10-N2)-methyltransferase